MLQNPTLSLEGAPARLIIDAQDGPVVLVGHSYGGAVITQAGTDQNVAALAYIARSRRTRTNRSAPSEAPSHN